MMRLVAAGLAGGAALNLGMLLTFRVLGMGCNGGGILLDPSVQSAKLIAAWTDLHPLPRVMTHPLLMSVGILFSAIRHAWIYRWLAPTWPPGVAHRATQMVALLFFLSYLDWESFRPFNQFGEPIALIALELVFWTIITAVESFATVAVLETAFPFRREVIATDRKTKAPQP